MPQCARCQKRIGLFGNTRIHDGVLCKECAVLYEPCVRKSKKHFRDLSLSELEEIRITQNTNHKTTRNILLVISALVLLLFIISSLQNAPETENHSGSSSNSDDLALQGDTSVIDNKSETKTSVEYTKTDYDTYMSEYYLGYNMAFINHSAHSKYYRYMMFNFSGHKLVTFTYHVGVRNVKSKIEGIRTYDLYYLGNGIWENTKDGTLYYVYSESITIVRNGKQEKTSFVRTDLSYAVSRFNDYQ